MLWNKISTFLVFTLATWPTLAMARRSSPDEVVRLPRCNIYPDLITLSGFSSGGTFAQHLQFSYSSLFSGIAVFQHAFYRCGPGDGVGHNYNDACTLLSNTPRQELYSVEKAQQDIKHYFEKGMIENPNHLRNKKLYVLVGTLNWVQSPDICLKILEIYEPYIRNPNAIRVRALAANLTLPTNNFGGPCSEDSEANYFLSNCGLSAPYEALNFLTDERVNQPPPAHREIQLGPLQMFDQTEFTDKIQGEHIMDKVGFLYCPRRCHHRKCLIHFYFHGCKAGREFTGANHIRHSGFLEIAELNDIIMVFPQVVKNSKNTWGCWDVLGLTGKFYATQRAPQVRVVRNMIARILGEDDN